MRVKKIIHLIALIMFISFGALACSEENIYAGGPITENVQTLPAGFSEQDGIEFMREEEKLARDVYLASEARWGTRIFSNISEAEQRHMNAVLGLLERRGIEDPAADLGGGVFKEPRLQALYDDLVERSARSEVDALLGGAEIEEIDLLDIAAQLDRFEDADVQQVYQNLSRGSRNHLRSFVRVLARRGVVYTPKHMGEGDFEAIISTDKERGQGRGGEGCEGKGRGGQGRGGQGWGRGGR